MNDLGCGHPISSSVFRIGTIVLAVMYGAVSSASTADDITGLMIFAIVNIYLFIGGVATSSVKKMGSPALLLALVLLGKPASAYADSTMPLALKSIPSSG